MVRSRNVSELRTQMRDLGPVQPMLVPRPPFSFSTTSLLSMFLMTSGAVSVVRSLYGFTCHIQFSLGYHCYGLDIRHPILSVLRSLYGFTCQPSVNRVLKCDILTTKCTRDNKKPVQDTVDIRGESSDDTQYRVFIYNLVFSKLFW